MAGARARRRAPRARGGKAGGVPAARDRAILAGSVAVFVGGAIVARRAELTRTELRWFQLVNGLSHRVYAPVWGLMQLGSLGGPLVTGAVIRAAGHRRLGTRVMTVGALTWLAAKAVKPWVRRGRPAVTIPATRVLGHEQAGRRHPSRRAGWCRPRDRHRHDDQVGRRRSSRPEPYGSSVMPSWSRSSWRRTLLG